MTGLVRIERRLRVHLLLHLELLEPLKLLELHELLVVLRWYERISLRDLRCLLSLRNLLVVYLHQLMLG